MITDWDDAYANAPHIPAAQEFPLRWANSASDARAAFPALIYITYL